MTEVEYEEGRRNKKKKKIARWKSLQWKRQEATMASSEPSSDTSLMRNLPMYLPNFTEFLLTSRSRGTKQTSLLFNQHSLYRGNRNGASVMRFTRESSGR